MKIASFNVNSVKARLNNLTQWLGETNPDVVCLQELKCVDEAFPREAIEDLGYNVAVHGQKTYNGVAILSKFPMEDVTPRLPGDDSDEQARYIEALISTGTTPIRVGGLYLPNGNPVHTEDGALHEKYTYKLAWMERLIKHAKILLTLEEPFVLAGDYNIIPQAEDCHKPSAWKDDALFRQESRDKFRKLINLGLTDSFRACHTEPNRYTFWDYQAGAWQKDNGIRIDHLLLSPQAADMLTACDVDKEIRGREKPSDHVPIWIELDVPE